LKACHLLQRLSQLLPQVLHILLLLNKLLGKASDDAALEGTVSSTALQQLQPHIRGLTRASLQQQDTTPHYCQPCFAYHSCCYVSRWCSVVADQTGTTGCRYCRLEATYLPNLQDYCRNVVSEWSYHNKKRLPLDQHVVHKHRWNDTDGN